MKQHLKGYELAALSRKTRVGGITKKVNYSCLFRVSLTRKECSWYGNIMLRSPRRKSIHNYALVNARGLTVSKSIKRKGEANKKVSVKQLEQTVTKLANNLSTQSPLESALAESVNAMPAITRTPINRGRKSKTPKTSKTSKTPKQVQKSKTSINAKQSESISETDNMATVDEEKEQMRLRIAQLEAMVTEKERKEEEKRKQREQDREYQLLKEKLEGLERRMSESSRSDKGDKSKKPSKNKTISISSNENWSDADSKIKNKLPSLNDIQNLLSPTDRSATKKRSKRSKKRKRGKPVPPSDSSSTSSSSSDSSDDEDSLSDDHTKRKKRGRKVTSGLYAKAGNTQLVSRELYAHTELDDELSGDKDIFALSFNLLVAGELEIITSDKISEQERLSRTQVLKALAYKHEHLPRQEIIKQYVNFIRKVEKGKFAWGSRTSLRTFEQQLLYNISLEARKVKTSSPSKSNTKQKMGGQEEILPRL